MEIKSTFTNRSGQVLDVVYRDIENEAEFGNRKIKAVHGYCFYGDKLVIVYAADKGRWTFPGGNAEKDESIRDAVTREVHEESNMKVIRQHFIGYQDVSEPQGIISQTRSICLVEPYGPFVSDPDGDITEIKLIDPKDYKQYVDWGVVGDHIMARALELKGEMEKEGKAK